MSKFFKHYVKSKVILFYINFLAKQVILRGSTCNSFLLNSPTEVTIFYKDFKPRCSLLDFMTLRLPLKIRIDIVWK